MQGYTPFTNIGSNCKRGVLLYIREDLNATEVKLVNEANFEESTWVEIKLRDADTLLSWSNSSIENHIHEAVSRRNITIYY